MPCSRSSSPVTGRGTDAFGVSCEIDSACRTGNCRKSSLFPFKTNRPDGTTPCVGCTTGCTTGCILAGHLAGHLAVAARAQCGPPIPKWTGRKNVTTYRITNFLGRIARTGKRKKQITKQTSAPTLQAPKTNNRSHRLTVAKHRYQPVVLAHHLKQTARNRG